MGCEVASNNTNPQKLSFVNVCNDPVQCVTFDAKVEGINSQIVLDSGSGLSIMSSEMFSCVNAKSSTPLVLSNNTILAKTATGDKLSVLGTTCVTVDLGDSCWIVECYVVSNFKYAFLLGTDFMIRSGAKIDLDSLHVSLGQSRLPIRIDRKPRQVQVNVVEALEIPARSEAILSGRVNGLSGTVLVEPKHALSCENGSLVYPARCVAYVNDGIVPLKIANPNSFPVKVFPETCVGMAETVGVDDVNEQTGENDLHSFPNELSWLKDIDMSDSSLNEDERNQLLNLLQEYSDVFVTRETDVGCARRFSHKIDTGNNDPIRQRPYRIPHSQQEMVDEHIQLMLKKGIIQESNSPWSQPLVIVTKKDGSPRFCVDFRKLNAITKKQVFPMPRIDEVLDSLGDSCYFTTLDLASGYWQVPMDPDDMEKTAFCTRSGNFHFRVMAMGLTNASFTFQKMMQLVLSGLQWNICMVYLDDVIVFSKSFQKHLDNLRLVFDRFRKEGLKLKPKKCHFCKPEVLYLGHIVGKNGIRPNPEKVSCISNYPVPTNCSEVRSFVALCSYYRRFIKDFASKASPLHALLKKGVQFKWTEKCQLAFEQLRDSLLGEPILSYPDFDHKFELYTDASNTGIGAVLSQNINGEEKTLAYASRSLKPHERKYSTIERECLAMVWAVKYFRPYLFGKEFDIITDHNPLRWLDNAKDPHSRLSRWSLTLQSYSFNIRHRSGKLHNNADALSRMPEPVKNETTGKQVHVSAIDVPGLQLDRVRQMQNQDPSLQVMLDYLRKGDIPDDASSARKLMASCEDYLLEDDVLYHLDRGRARSRNAIRKQLVVPRSLKDEVMLSCHEELTSGHLGFEKTYLKIRTRYFWTGMYSEIEQWCKSCVDCATKKTPRNLPKAPLQPIPVEGPFDRVAVDVLGPFPTSEKGNKYVIIFTDYLTKWVEAFAVKDFGADTTAKLFVEEVICRHSAPRKLLSDRGKNFLSKVVKAVCKLVNTAKVNTTSYHPECDGLLERFNHSLTTIISMYVSEHQKDWDLFIPYALFAYRTAVQSSTKETPFFLMYGRDPRLPIDVSLLKAKEQYANTTDYRSVLAERFMDARKLAHENIELAQQRQKVQYDKNAKEVNYEVGERVWLYTPNNKTGLSSKLTHNWHGPFRILAKKSPVNYLLDSNEERNITQVVHVNRLKPFISLDSRPDDTPQQEATTTTNDEPNDSDEEYETASESDPAELEVDKILDKRTTKNRSGRKETQYLIQWKDKNIEPSWEPVSHLNCAQLLEDFEHSLRSQRSIR